MDAKLAEVFDGKNIQNNDGTHLDCEIVDDKVWQEKYSSIIIYPLSQYDIPKGPIWKSFLQLIAKEIGRVWESKWNMEKVTCFISMILQRSPDLKRWGGNIKRRIKRRILEWEEMLNLSTIICAEVYFNRKR